MFKLSITSFLANFLAIADTSTSTDDEKITHRFLIYLGVFMALGGIVWGTISLISGLIYQALIPFGYTLVTALNFTYLYYSKNFKVSQNLQVFISLITPFLLQIALGGFIPSGGVILWSVITILGGFTFFKKSITIRWLTAYIFLVILSGIVDQRISTFGININDVPISISVLFFTLNITLISMVIFGLFYYFVNSKEIVQKKLINLANTDPLTGLPNRRSFFEKSKIEFLHAKRYKSSFSLIMIDIDWFKNINDIYGHDVGDKVLEKFAELLIEHTRAVDVLGRYGGEEFVILLPKTSLKDAHIFALRVIDSAQKIVVNTLKGTCSFTISAGLSQFINTDENLSETLKRADNALYKAKENGRNQLQEG